jgi:hypothetical protein
MSSPADTDTGEANRGIANLLSLAERTKVLRVAVRATDELACDAHFLSS